MKPKITFREYIAEIGQAELARRLKPEPHRSTVSSWYRGRTIPRNGYIQQLIRLSKNRLTLWAITAREKDGDA